MLLRNKRIIEPKETKKSKPLPKSNQPIDDQESQQKTDETTLTKKLGELYENITAEPSYSSKIESFLRYNKNYATHTAIRKKTFPRRRVIARFPNEIWMADLIEYGKHTKHINRGYVYILIIIDCFSKQVWGRPLKTKSGPETAQAFESILKDLDEFPVNLVTDSGREFFNYDCNKILQAYGINHYSVPTKSKFKASVVERVIRTLKTRLERYFAKRKSKKWVDVIDQFISNYNNTPHKSHGFKPLDVSNDNRDIVYKRLFPRIGLTTICKYRKGDKVRHILKKKEFEKGYTKSWTDEVFTIIDVRQSNQVCWYILADHAQDKIDGIWYYYQLKLVKKHDNSSDRSNSE